MASWWPGPPRQAYYEDSVYSYLLRVGVVVGIFLLALLISFYLDTRRISFGLAPFSRGYMKDLRCVKIVRGTPVKP
jgi:hypothetical protein